MDELFLLDLDRCTHVLVGDDIPTLCEIFLAINPSKDFTAFVNDEKEVEWNRKYPHNPYAKTKAFRGIVSKVLAKLMTVAVKTELLLCTYTMRSFAAVADLPIPSTADLAADLASSGPWTTTFGAEWARLILTDQKRAYILLFRARFPNSTIHPEDLPDLSLIHISEPTRPY